MNRNVELRFCRKCGNFIGFFVEGKEHEGWNEVEELLFAPVLRYKYNSICEVCERRAQNVTLTIVNL